MKLIINIFILVIVVSCTTNMEVMRTNVPNKGDLYIAYNTQVGGRGTSKFSSGSAFASDNQQSFADAVQGYVARGLSLDQTKIALSKEVTTRYGMGQFTLQQANALKAQIALAKSSDELTKFLASIPK